MDTGECNTAVKGLACSDWLGRKPPFALVSGRHMSTYFGLTGHSELRLGSCKQSGSLPAQIERSKVKDCMSI